MYDQFDSEKNSIWVKKQDWIDNQKEQITDEAFVEVSYIVSEPGLFGKFNGIKDESKAIFFSKDLDRMISNRLVRKLNSIFEVDNTANQRHS